MTTQVHQLASRTIQRGEQEVFPGSGLFANVIEVECYDVDTDMYVSAEQLELWHNAGLACGYHIKMREEFLGKLDYPNTGLVYSVDPDAGKVTVNTFDRLIEFDRETFVRIWEVD